MSIEIKRLIERGENQQLDFKFQITDSKKIARTLSAFSNTDGGTLLIGVKDNGKIAGIRSEEEYYMIDSAAHLHCKPVVEFESERMMIDGKNILIVNVPESNKKPHYAPDKNGKYKAFIRVHDQNLVANKIQTEVWKRNQQKDKGVYLTYTDKDKLLLEYLKDHESITFMKFVKLASISRYKAEKILLNFILMNIIHIVFTEKTVFYKLNENFDTETDINPNNF